jgi:DHA2 family multidrug resistance protein
MNPAELTPVRRRLITIFIMAAAVMNQVDTTIANVALPHIQGSISASREQIGWVLTSYIVALAIFTPLTGWLGDRFGRRKLILFSILAFTAASGLCGIAVNLHELIAFRMLQGVAGAALVPMSQATLLDINPPEDHGKAMAIFGLAAVTGPLFGPLLGGWLTENFSWRWCFLINLPIGLFSWIGLSAVMPEWKHEDTLRLDFLGFGLLALAIGSVQLMLDRGQLLDWFASTEIWIEATLAITCFYLFVVHSFTTGRPFVSLAVFTDRNFVICSTVGFFLGLLIYSPMALLPQMLEGLMGYPIMEVGLVMAPRGIGVLIAMLVMGRIIARVDYRLLIFIGLAATALSMFDMSRMSLQADSWPLITSGVIQGAGSSMVFVPLAALAFATLPARYRGEAAAMSTLLRNAGASVGIAVMQAMTVRDAATAQSRLTEGLRPDNPAFNAARPDFDFNLPESAASLAQEVARQAMMVSYVDAFRIMFIVAAASSLLVFLLRSSRRSD